jgi:PKD repeat protein
MKLLTSITAVLAGLTLSAQDYDYKIAIARNQSVTTAYAVSIMTVSFNTWGSHFTDGMDATQFIIDSSFIRPYTVDSAGMHLMTTDSRPHLRSTLAVPFGIFSNTTDEVYIQGAWSNPATADLFDVTLIENSIGSGTDMNTESSYSVSADVAFNNQFTIVFTPKAHVVTFDESCFGEANGSAFIQSPEPNWQMDVYYNASLLTNFTVANKDTFLSNLSAGNYTFVYMLDNQPVDTFSAAISGPAQITAGFNMSNTIPEAGELITFTNTSVGAMDYYWDFGDGNTYQGASPTHVYATSGLYAVTLTAYNITGCSDENTSPVMVLPSSNSIPMVNEGHIDHSHNMQREATVVVNAQDGQAHITSANEIAIAQINIYSVTGQLIYSGTGNDNTFSYETPGIYIAHIVYADGQQESKKVTLN